MIFKRNWGLFYQRVFSVKLRRSLWLPCSQLLIEKCLVMGKFSSDRMSQWTNYTSSGKETFKLYILTDQREMWSIWISKRSQKILWWGIKAVRNRKGKRIFPSTRPFITKTITISRISNLCMAIRSLLETNFNTMIKSFSKNLGLEIF